MAREIKTKSSFGTVGIDHFSPPLSGSAPPAINVHVSFEEALKLELGLRQLLMKLNSYNRSTKAGHDACVNLCVFTDVHSITLNEGRLGARKPRTEDRAAGSLNMEERLAEYVAEVNAAPLRQTTKDTYIDHATSFVRWLRGEFKPGSRK